MLFLLVLFVRYGFIVDAGSTASRLYCYTWDETDTSPFVSSYAPPFKVSSSISLALHDPTAVNRIFKEFVDKAKTTIPATDYGSTIFVVTATSSMRALSKSDQDYIMGLVHDYLKNNSPFNISDDCCRVISTDDEAMYQWSAANMEKIDEDSAETSAIIDLTSGSMNFAVQYNESKYKEYVKTLKFSNLKFKLFDKSFPGYGIDDAINSHIILLAQESQSTTVQSPCFLKNTKFEDNFISVSGTGNFQKCYEMMKNILSSNCSEAPCIFDNVPRPPYSSLIGLSTYFYMSSALGLAENAKISEIETKADNYCKLTEAEAKALVGTDNEEFFNRYCIYAAYGSYFLKEGLGVNDQTNFIITNQTKGQTISYTLSAIIAIVNPPEIIHVKLKWYEILTIALVIAVIVIIILVFSICCCVKKHKAKKLAEEAMQAERWHEIGGDDDDDYSDMENVELNDQAPLIQKQTPPQYPQIPVQQPVENPYGGEQLNESKDESSSSSSSSSSSTSSS